MNQEVTRSIAPIPAVSSVVLRVHTGFRGVELPSNVVMAKLHDDGDVETVPNGLTTEGTSGAFCGFQTTPQDPVCRQLPGSL